MAVTNGWGQAAVNNTIDYGKGKTTATNDWGAIYDSSASGDTSLGTATTFPNTKSILLDGVDDFVNCGDPSNLSFGNATTDSPFSISAWIKVSAIGSTHYIVTKSLIVNSSAAKYEYLFYVSSSGNLVVSLYDGFRSIRRSTFSSGGPVSAGAWHHVAMTYNGVGGTNANQGVKLYLNNSLITASYSANNTYVAMHNTSQAFKIGESTGGNIDEVAVFDSELSASDVTSIYNSGVPNNLNDLSTPPLSWWRCGDGDTSPTLTDNGTGGNNGTMTNFSTFSTDVPT